jgi:hypothetical protein
VRRVSSWWSPLSSIELIEPGRVIQSRHSEVDPESRMMLGQLSTT